MVEFRCVKCDDKEYGIVYYEKVFSFNCLKLREGEALKKITIVPIPEEMNYLFAE
jgi:hypothetical protein